MLYHWLYPLADTFSGLNVVRYITFRTAAATLTALFISFIVGPWASMWSGIMTSNRKCIFFIAGSNYKKKYCLESKATSETV